jgi:hypothetical protein
VYLITITGTNLLGQTVTETLGDDRNKAATVSAFEFLGDGSVFEEVELLDALYKQWFPRNLISRPFAWVAGRQHQSPGLAFDFCRHHRRKVPMKGTVRVTLAGGYKFSALNAALRIASMVPFGVRTITRYEVMCGDFE